MAQGPLIFLWNEEAAPTPPEPNYKPYTQLYPHFRVRPHRPQQRRFLRQIPSAVTGTVSITFQAPTVAVSGTVVGSGVPHFRPYDELLPHLRVSPHQPQIRWLKYPVPSAVSGTASITFAAPSIAASGTVTGSGVPAGLRRAQQFVLPRPRVQPQRLRPAVPGVVAITGTAAVAFGAPAISASGTVSTVGLPALIPLPRRFLIPTPIQLGVAAPRIIGTVSVAISAPGIAVAGRHQQLVAGTVAVVIAAPDVYVSGHVLDEDILIAALAFDDDMLLMAALDRVGV